MRTIRTFRLHRLLAIAFVPALLIVGVASVIMAAKVSAACPGSCQWPSAGRDFSHGYLTNGVANGPAGSRGAVWPSNSGLMQVDSAAEFIAWMQPYLFNTANGSVNNSTGAAAYVVTSMLGYKGPDFGGNFLDGVNTARARWNDWQNLVTLYDANGWVNWNGIGVNCTPYVQANLDYNMHDVFFFNAGAGQPRTCESEEEIVFTNPQTGGHYKLKKICGNPVGETEPIVVDDFLIEGRTTVSDATVIPGDVITFRHYLQNNSNQSRTTSWTTHNGLTNAQIDQGNNEVIAPNAEELVNLETMTIPSGAPPGTQYCRYIRFTPASNNGGTGQGDTVCATVVADFSLQPSVTPNTTTAQNGDTVTFTYNVTNAGVTASGLSPGCKVVANNHPSGYAPLPQQDADRNSDPGYSPPVTVCVLPFQPGTTTTVATETVTITDATPGGVVCRSLVVNPKDETGGPRASAEACVVIAKAPFVHFMGNDVWAGGGFVGDTCDRQSKITTTARQLSDGSIAGSATEYAGFALDRISNFGTANKALLSSSAPVGKLLTFSNLDSANLGFYGAAQHCINDYLNKFTSLTPDASPAINIGGRGSGTWSVAGGTVFSGDIPVGAQQVYVVNGDAVIAGNLRYPANYNGLGEIPSLIIIATGTVTVQSAVTQMDGIFVAKGNFKTCDPPPGNLSVSICNQQLVVNGVVVANRLDLLRTFGADGGTPAEQKRAGEVFNFRPEVYLRSALSGTGTMTIRTVEQRDAPARY